MTELQQFEVLSAASNNVVARYPGRSHPGVLVQGDSLRCLLEEVDELVEELQAKNNEAVIEIADTIRQRLSEILRHYEAVMDGEGLVLPYSRRVTMLAQRTEVP